MLFAVFCYSIKWPGCAQKTWFCHPHSCWDWFWYWLYPPWVFSFFSIIILKSAGLFISVTAHCVMMLRAGPGELTDGQCVKSAWIWVDEPGSLSTQLNSTFQSNYCSVQWKQGRILTCTLSLCCFSLSFLFLKWVYLAEYFPRKSKVCDYNHMNSHQRNHKTSTNQICL